MLVTLAKQSKEHRSWTAVTMRPQVLI